jgi:hypothetical protein
MSSSLLFFKAIFAAGYSGLRTCGEEFLVFAFWARSV